MTSGLLERCSEEGVGVHASHTNAAKKSSAVRTCMQLELPEGPCRH